MINEIKKLVKHSGIYSFGNLSGNILSFLLLPVYTRLLTTEQYGILALVAVFRVVVQRAVNLGTQSSVVKVFFEVDTEEEKKIVVSTAFIFLTVISVFVTLILFFFREGLAILFLKSPQLSYLFAFALFTSLFFIIKTVPLSIFRAREKTVMYSVFAFFTLFLGIVFNIIFVIILKENVKGVLKSALISQLIIFLLILVPFSKNLVFKFKKEYLLRMLTFGVPLVPSGLAMWILTLLDRYFLRIFTTMEMVGVYSVGYKIATIVSILIVIPFSLAWSPLMLRWHKHEEDPKVLYVKAYKYFSIASLFLALIISIYAKEVIWGMTTQPFYNAYKIVYFIVLAYVFHGFFMIFATGCTLVRKTFYFPIATGIAAIMNTVLNIFLIPRFQMMGAAVATIASYFAMTVLILIFSERYYKIPFNFRDTVKIVLVTTILYILGLFITSNFAIAILLKFGLILSFFPLLYLLRVFTRKEIDTAKKFVKMRLKK